MPSETISRSKLEGIFGETLTGRDEFSLGRLSEGYGIATYIKSRSAGPVTIVDVGTGNGGVSIALANMPDFRVVSIDRVVNRDFLALRRRTHLPVWHVLADANALPLRGQAADFVTFLEILEHLPLPTTAGYEVMRILKTGGECMVVTPARLRYLLRPDPHYGLRCLLLLPDRVQALVARGLGVTEYDVQHTFWHLKGIARQFPGNKKVQVFWDRLPPFPDYSRNRVWWALRHFLWDRLVFQKLE